MEAANLLRVLIVDDNKVDAHAIHEMLKDAVGMTFDVTCVSHLRDMNRLLEYQQFHVILLSISLLELSGNKTIAKIRDISPAVPIVALVSLEDNFIASMVDNLGVDDYIVKNYASKQTLIHSIHSVIHHRKMVYSLSRLVNQHSAMYDALTGVPNRALLLDRLNQAVTVSKRNNELFALMLIDIDNTQVLNSELGKEKVDLIIKQVGARLTACIHSPDTVARFSGDKFIVLITGVKNPTDVSKIAQVAQRLICEPIEVNMMPQFITASTGIVLFPEDGNDPKALLSRVDDALSVAKTQGANSIVYFNTEMQKVVNQQLILEKDLRMAWAKGEFFVYYQPQIDLSTGSTMGVEAKLYWNHPDRGLLSPAEFMKLVSETGLLLPLNDWLFRRVCMHHRQWAQATGQKVKVALTICEQHFYHKDFWEKFNIALNDHDMDPANLILQFDEKVLFANEPLAINLLNELSHLGCVLAINDYGNDGSAMGFVRHLPVKILKLPSSLLKSITTSSGQYDYVKATIAVGHSLKKEILACGVSDVNLQSFAVEQGCRYVQGDLYGSAMPEQESLPLIEKQWFTPLIKRNGEAHGAVRSNHSSL